MSEAAAAPLPSDRRWLFGPFADLVFGCGLGYALFFTFQIVAGDTMRAWLPLALLPILTLLVSGPHYGATLLRVYQRREDRRKYAFFAVYVTLALCVVFVAGLRSAAFGSLVLTLYLTWSPWHYTGQNYGIALMFLGRRGVRITLPVKRLIYASFVLSYVLLFFSFHGGGHVGDYAPAAYDGSIYSFVPLGIPTAISFIVLPAAATGYVITLVSAAVLLLRYARLRDLAPTLLLIGLQSVWFTAPVLARLTGQLQGVEPFTLQYATYAFMWIAVGHAVQYLWITTYFAKQSGLAAGNTRFLGRALVAGSAVWVIPVLLFAPGALGNLPKDMGLGVMTASVVNLHHFVLDGAIWKLRDSRIARVLMRTAESGAESGALAPVGRGWVVGAWALGVLALAWGLGSRLVTFQFRSAIQDEDLAGAIVGIDRMESFLTSGPDDYVHVSTLAMRQGDLSSAREHADRSLELYPTARAWTLKGKLHGMEGDWAATARAVEAAVDLEPGHVEALSLAGEAEMRRGNVDRALELLERAVEIDPDHAASQRRLGSVCLALGDLERAREHLARADALGDRGALPNLGEALRRLGDLPGAVEVLRRSAAGGDVPLQTLRRLAWILATTRAADLRAPEESLELARRLNELSGHQHPGHLETLAAAAAATGDFESAQEWQGQALARLSGPDAQAAQARLAFYRRGEPWRE